MATNDKYSLVCVQQYSNTSIANCFYINVIDDAGATDVMQDISDEFESAWIDQWKTIQTSHLDYECNLIRKMEPTSEPARVFPLSVSGTGSGDGLPVNQAGCVNTWASDGEPRWRGRLRRLRR